MSGFELNKIRLGLSVLFLAGITAGCASSPHRGLTSVDEGSSTALQSTTVPPAAQSSSIKGSLSPSGDGWATSGENVWITVDGGAAFSPVVPPLSPSGITDGALNGQDVFLAGVEQGNPKFTRSTDGGSTWTSPTLPASPSQAATADIVSSDGSVLGLVVQDQSSSNFSPGAWYGTSDDGQTWSQGAIPSFGPVSSTPGRLWLVGGPQQMDLYSSSNSGSSWNSLPSPQSGSTLSPPETLNTGDLVLVATSSTSEGSDAAPVTVYDSNNGGASWSKLASIAVPGTIGAGVAVASGVAQGSIWLVAPDGSKIFQISGSGSESVISPDGLPAGVTSLTLSSAGAAWATAFVSSCPSGKSSCSGRDELYKSIDGGQVWAPISP